MADAVLLSQSSASRSKLAVSSGSAFRAQQFWTGVLGSARARLACAASAPTVTPPSTAVLSAATVAGAATAAGSTYSFSGTAQPRGAHVRVFRVHHGHYTRSTVRWRGRHNFWDAGTMLHVDRYRLTKWGGGLFWMGIT